MLTPHKPNRANLDRSPAALLLHPPATKRSARSRAWLLLPSLGGGLAIACGILLLRGEKEVRTVSQVVRDMQETALRVSDTPGLDHGGSIGPWWIAATDANPFTGELRNFRVRSGSMIIAARTAELVVDARQDTFSFELSDVVFTRVPDPKETMHADHYLMQLDTHTLGPAPYGIDIVEDVHLAETISPASIAKRD